MASGVINSGNRNIFMTTKGVQLSDVTAKNWVQGIVEHSVTGYKCFPNLL